MMFLGHELSFWIAVILATIFKLLTSTIVSPLRALITILAAFFAAWAFTDPVIHWLGWDAATYKVPMAALLTLTGEGIMRSLTTLNLEKLVALWKEFRK